MVRILLACILMSLSMSLCGGQEPQGRSADAAVDRPNLLVVVTDDQRFDQLGCAGHAVLKTPTMDALAEKGVRFTHAFVTTPICAASRASLMTGRWEGQHHFTFGQPRMGRPLARDTYFARLKELGYRTSFVGKWGVKFEPGLRKEFIDEFHGMTAPYLRPGQRHLTDRAADLAIGCLPDDASDEPFCLTLSFNAPHAEDPHPDQFIPPPDLAELYGDAEVPVPRLAVEGFKALPEFLQKSLGRIRWAWRFDDREKQIQRTRDYWRMITGVDRALGRVLDALEERGLAENTVVVFMGDNGFFLGERGLAGKWLIYEESIRVPLIVYDPRASSELRGTTAAPMVLNVDVAPTLLELAGGEVPVTYEGRSLAPFLRGEAPRWRKDFLVEHRMRHADIPKSRGVRGERWVYARYDEQEPPYEQLFDLQTDPDELVNLANDEAVAGVLAEMRARCEWLTEAPGWAPRPAGLRCDGSAAPLAASETPTLTWRLYGEEPLFADSAYQVLVSTDRASLDSDRGDLWDSGKVAAGSEPAARYGGEALPSGQSCFWKVRAFDAAGTPTAWSQVATFTVDDR